MQARQQREVASFGQLALGGADIDALQAEAARLLARVLEVDIAAVLKLHAGEDEFADRGAASACPTTRSAASTGPGRLRLAVRLHARDRDPDGGRRTGARRTASSSPER